jgi:16S rRNA (adenine1518-N6/adenine1519-N6)-dimethyltransferase
MKANKDLGQHFLNDPSIAEDIVLHAQLGASDRVWEIGPGLGILSRAIVASGAQLTAFELDRRFREGLEAEFGERMSFVMRDILGVSWQDELPTDGTIKLVANIPYQITSPLLYKIEACANRFECVVLMIQKEVADRLTASPGTKDYGQMTLRLALLFDIEILFYVGKEKFDPPPRVESAVIKMTPRKIKPQIRNLDIFYRLIQCAFAHRRKTLRNNIGVLLSKDKFELLESKTGIKLSRRGETLSEEEFILLSDSIPLL